MAMSGDEISAVNAYALEQAKFLQEDLTKYRTFPLSQGISLKMADVSDTVKKGVCWAMSYDWARFQVYDYRVNQIRFAKIKKKTAVLQQRLQEAGDAQQILDEFAASEGFRRELVAEGVKPLIPQRPFSLNEWALRDILSAIDTDPKTDRAGVRMLGFVGGGKGHEIALRVKAPFRFFDPNYGEFEFPTLAKLKQMVTYVLNQTYIDMMSRWDIYLVDRAYPRRQQVLAGVIEIPAHVNGAPEPAHLPRVDQGELSASSKAELDDMMDFILFG